MREQTEYEKERWGGGYGGIEIDESNFIFDGDEWGEAFNAALSCVGKESYGLADWFVKAAEIQVLDMYYDQLIEAYVERNRDEPEEYGLPPMEEFVAKAKELGVETITEYGGKRTDDERRLWDWAMDWRDEHWQETREQWRIKNLRAELERLEKK